MSDVVNNSVPMEERLARVQDTIRYTAQLRNEAMAEGNKAAVKELENELEALKAERQTLLDEQLGIQREQITGTFSPVRRPRPVRGAQSRPPLLLRLLFILLVFGGVAVLVVGGLFLAADRLLAPPPVEALDQGQAPEEDFLGGDNLTAEQRLLGLYLAVNSDAIRRAPSDDPTPVSFVVEQGQTAVEIADRLESEGFVEDAELFRRLLQYRGADQALEAGTFQLARNMTMDEIIVALQAGHRNEVVFTLPEGWRAEQMAAELEALGVVSAEEYMALVRDPSRFSFDFLQQLPPGSTLEGYLFPDTYSVFADEVTAEDIIRLQLETFARRVTTDLREAAAARGMGLHNAVILASIVEREAVVPEERPTIAGVYINRWEDGTVLNADPTIQYALGYQSSSGQWWKRPLTLEDLALDSPYNTYTVAGLPPGPIANPGLDSIRSTILAPDTPYYYFVSRNDGTHVFATTLEEHEANVAQFQSGE